MAKNNASKNNQFRKFSEKCKCAERARAVFTKIISQYIKNGARHLYTFFPEKYSMSAIFWVIFEFLCNNLLYEKNV